MLICKIPIRFVIVCLVCCTHYLSIFSRYFLVVVILIAVLLLHSFITSVYDCITNVSNLCASTSLHFYWWLSLIFLIIFFIFVHMILKCKLLFRLSLTHIDLSSTNVPFLYPMETPENLRFLSKYFCKLLTFSQKNLHHRYLTNS